MRERGWGRIVTVGSSGVLQPIDNLGLSNAVRSALVGWSKSLSNDVAADGVTVNMLLPGRIHTERVDELDAAAAERTGRVGGGHPSRLARDDPRRALRHGRGVRRRGRVPRFGAGELRHRLPGALRRRRDPVGVNRCPTTW